MGNRSSQLQAARTEIAALKDRIALLETQISGHTDPDAQRRLQELSDRDVEAFVNEILNDQKTNIHFIPDSIERRVYYNVFRLTIEVINRLFSTAHLNVLNHQLKLQLVPMALDATLELPTSACRDAPHVLKPVPVRLSV